MSDDKKLTLSGRKPLGVKGGDVGQVRQSFSHGRSKSVVVEHKKKRVLKKGAPGAAAPTSEVAPQADTQAPKPQKTFKPKRAGNDKAGSLTGAEQANRMRVLEEAKLRAEEEKKRAEEEARRKAAEEAERKKREAAEAAARTAEDAAREEAEAAAKKKAAEVAARKAQEEEAKRVEDEAAAKTRAEEESRRKAALEARAVQLKKASEAQKADASRSPEDAERAKPRKKPNRGGGDDKKRENRPSRGRGGDTRQKGRLTIAGALSGEEGQRQRSIAAFKRAQEKKRQAALGNKSSSHERQAREVTIPEAITVQELANRMAERGAAVIKTLMGMGVMATINETLDQDTAQLVVEEFGHTPKRVSDSDVEIGLVGAEDKDEDLKPRAPIVTVMGHVDHGKTSLLDSIRKANVVSGEAGGITQHIGAYQVKVPSGDKVTFLDTPGHAAFTQMRARGASVTDIVVLVVAADDSVKPQTIEAINHAKAAEVPIIVAINKIDREGADPNRVRTDLLQHEVIVESMSGDVQDVEVSALKGTGIDNLLEALHLQAELLELKANPVRPAEGVVVEAKLDRGRGPVATVLIQRGTLNVGDIVVAGPEWGKVRALNNDQGSQIKSAGPSVPVEILGLNGTPGAGDDIAVVDSEARAREVTSYRQEQVKRKKAAAAKPKSLESLFSSIREDDQKAFDVVVKADVQGSVEAIAQALEKAGNDDIACRVIHGGVGGITETDITLAAASNALVIGFNVRPNKQAREVAERDGVAIKYYSIIYDLIDDVKSAMAGELGPEFEEDVIGNAEIKEVFSAGKTGKAAGCMVLDGAIRRDAKARLLRDDVIIWEGEIDNLRRFKDDVNEVKSGTECGMTFENFQDFKAGDMVQVYTLREVARTL